MDYAKNFKGKNIALRIISFIIYFLVSGFMGKLCTIIMEPAFSLFFKLFGGTNYEETVNTILYIIGLIIIIAAISFFSKREGYNDTEFFRFSFPKTILSYISSGIIFCVLSLVISAFSGSADFFAAVKEYFLSPYFLPENLSKALYNSVFFPDNSILHNIFENIKYFILLKWTPFSLTVSFNILFTIIFYKAGRNHWIETKNKRIRRLQQGEKPSKSSHKRR